MATQYAILRTAKLKSAASMRGSLRHAFRAQNTPNADPELTPENTHFGAATVDEAMAKFRDRLDAVDGKIRSNAVLGIEYLVTGSPERLAEMSRAEQDAYFEDALGWLKERHGDDNIVYAGIHRDETSPHLYAYAVPLEEREKDGEKIQKLNARGFLGGSKHVLSEMQTEFAEKIGSKHGLERGVKGSRAKHQTVAEFYGKLDANFEGRKLPVERKVFKKGLLSRTEQSDEEFAHDVADYVRRKEGPTQTQVEMARRGEREANDTVAALDRQLKKVGDPRGLDSQRVAMLRGVTEKLHAQQEAEREERKEADKKKRLERRRLRDRGRNRGGGGR